MKITLTMPNLVLESLYLDYMQHLLTTRAQVRVDDMQRDEMVRHLLDGNKDCLNPGNQPTSNICGIFSRPGCTRRP